jgi:hypothetical protein
VRKGGAASTRGRRAEQNRALASDERVRPANLVRLQEIERERQRLEIERQKLIKAVGPLEIPKFDLRDFKKFRGATYSTWFKAVGADRARDIGTSPKLLDEEFNEFDLPKLFYSHSITGKVKWFGIVDRGYLIKHLNDRAPWDGNDFRDIYPNWEYTYQVREYLGGVWVRTYEYRAKSPLSGRDRRKEFHAE